MSETVQGMCENCNERPAEKPGVCPYRYEMEGDEETLCNCCEHCVRQCAEGV